jgi:hypothetical protein
MPQKTQILGFLDMNDPNRPNKTPHNLHSVQKESNSEIELRPDGEERFRKAVHAAAKSGPKHRAAKG